MTNMRQATRDKLRKVEAFERCAWRKVGASLTLCVMVAMCGHGVGFALHVAAAIVAGGAALYCIAGAYDVQRRCGVLRGAIAWRVSLQQGGVE